MVTQKKQKNKQKFKKTHLFLQANATRVRAPSILSPISLQINAKKVELVAMSPFNLWFCYSMRQNDSTGHWCKDGTHREVMRKACGYGWII